MPHFRTVAGACALAGLSVGAAKAPLLDPAKVLIDTPAIVPGSSDAVRVRCDAILAVADTIKRALENERGPATIANSLARYDRLTALIDEGTGETYLVAQANPNKAIRTAGEACVQRLSEFGTMVSLSQKIYARLAAIPITGLDAETAWVLKRQLLQYRLAGVDRDAATRAKVTALQKQITATGLVFDANIRDAQPETILTPNDLAGMPADFLAAHPTGSDGKIHISGESDTFTVMDFADKEDTRRSVYIAYMARAWPKNGPVLRELLTERADLARLLGYPSYAAVALADKMIATPRRAQRFIDEVNAAATPGADRDYGELLARWRQLSPGAKDVKRWNASYVARLLRKERYDVDDEAVRGYFTYEKARAGVFKLAHDLFGADIRPWNTPVWDPSVSAWELYDGKRLVGRFYLDPHPREGKYGHAAYFPIRTGVAGRAVPLGSLEVNFPASGAMDHYDVGLFLHEFGHLLHTLYSGHHRWALSNMGSLERDFIEAPSQFLEEWVWDYDTLATFASDAQGRPIPRDLVAKMNRARRFQQGIDAKGQLFVSAVSLDFYMAAPATLDFDRATKAAQERYNVYPYVPQTHFWAAFEHLNNYTAGYYTYVWSKAIALDLFTRFQKAGLRDRSTAIEYRRRVLAPGASVPAENLVTGFLGRPLSIAAYKARVSGN